MWLLLLKAQSERLLLQSLSDSKAEDPNLSIHGTFFGQSSFARHALVVESSVVKVPDDTDLVALCPLGCGMQT